MWASNFSVYTELCCYSLVLCPIVKLGTLLHFYSILFSEITLPNPALSTNRLYLLTIRL